MFRMPVLAVSAAFLAWTGPALAQDPVVNGDDPAALAAIVSGYGSARVSTAVDGTPMIEGRIEGIAFNVFFFNCDEDNEGCRTITFAAGWAVNGVDLEAVNRWNQEKRFGRAYLDEAAQPMLELDVNLFEGVSAGNFDDTVDWWRVAMTDFAASVVEAAPDGDDGDGHEQQDGSVIQL